jgi:hypothetical protein
MSEENGSPSEDRPIHPIQKLMDNPWLLLALGLLITLLSYTAWGWFDIATMEQAQLP